MSEVERQQPGDAEKVSAAADLLLGRTAENAGDAKPDDVQATPQQAAGEPGESPNPDDMLAQLLADPETDGQASAPEKAQPNSLESLAEIAGMEIKDLYSIAVPMADGGEPITIGELKDAMQTRSTFQQERDDFETSRISQETAILRQRTELQQLAAAIGEDNLKPEVLDLLRAQSASYMDQQRQQLLAMRPEWAEPEKAQAAQAEIASALESYGFTPAERSQLADARLIKAFYDLATYRKRIEAANSRMQELRGNAKPAAPRGRKPQTKTNAAKLIDQAKAAPSDQAKASAVAALIAGANK